MHYFKFIVFTICLTTATAYAQGKKYQISCREIKKIVDDLNKVMPKKREIKIECNETFDKGLFGSKKNYQSDITLIPSLAFCSSPEGINKKISFKHPIITGPSIKTIQVVDEIFKEQGIELEIGSKGTSMGEMYLLTSLSVLNCPLESHLKQLTSPQDLELKIQSKCKE